MNRPGKNGQSKLVEELYEALYALNRAIGVLQDSGEPMLLTEKWVTDTRDRVWFSIEELKGVGIE